MSEVLALARELIRRPSVTPEDAGCQALIGARLARAGFRVESLPFGAVQNLWAVYGEHGPLLVFAGHTDVVPPGPRERWDGDPFEPRIVDGWLYGRGAADMKASLAAMVCAAERFLAETQGRFTGRIGFLVTSDEEGDAVDGTARVVDTLVARGERIDWCLVGEPSSETALGDVIKHGRRGSLSGRLTVFGRQGHVAYPQRADNPIHRAAPLLAELCAARFDDGDADFPPTGFQISNIHAGTGAGNVIPGELTIDFNFRYSPNTRAEDLQTWVAERVAGHGLRHTLDWQHGARPFITRGGALLEALQAAVAEVTGRKPRLSTAGGTSDGRFIAPTGAQVVEIGPVNATIHQVNERVAVADLEPLAAIHQAVLRRLFPVERGSRK
ncbi:MAG: succinyl-diaminopimelate desuccinylase [Gammaproteobacteria bacterium]|nr:MAG: succinyl-diaminopimelate desuccinylase [Gammaproteobacteria bacterium]